MYFVVNDDDVNVKNLCFYLFVTISFVGFSFDNFNDFLLLFNYFNYFDVDVLIIKHHLQN